MHHRRHKGMSSGAKIAASLGLALFLMALSAALGNSAFSIFDPASRYIIWELRLPRTLLAFLAGGCLSVSGAAVQSVLKNPLASPYTIGVSAGASLGAGLVIISGAALSFAGGFTLPLAGFASALLTVGLVLGLSAAADKGLSNHTVILFGMVFSLFVSAVLTTISALFTEELKRITLWQMGSFALKGWPYVRLLLPFFLIGILGIARYTKELDILTFGEEEALSLGVEARKVKTRVFLFSAILTGGAVSLCGVIGFVDLIAPHAARRLVGASHRYVLPLSFFLGGSLMTASDLLARTAISPSELPVGAVTALMGAPFFLWIYFRKP